MKKLVTFFLALVMPIMLWAYDFQSGDLYYNITSDSTAMVTSKSASYPYNNGVTITSAVIPSSVSYSGKTFAVTAIDDYAFMNCTSLASLSIPLSMIDIGFDALKNTTLYNNSSQWENDVLYIGDCLIEAKTTISGSYVIKSNTRLIASKAFDKCSSLTSITIPENVQVIGRSCFHDCESLAKVVWNVKKCAEFYNSSSGGNYLFSNTPVTSFIFGEGVENVPGSLCYGLKILKSITIPASVTTIGAYAFNNCYMLNSVVFGNNVTTIGNSAFQNCSSLVSITIPNSVTDIGSSAFYKCSSLSSVTISNKLNNIRSTLFGGCSSLVSVTIPENVTNISSSAFLDCSSLTSITWNAKNYTNFSSSSSNPFYEIRSQITSFKFGDSVACVPNYLCYGMNNLQSIIIPNSVITIGNSAFKGCSSVTSIALDDAVTTIGDHTFQDCTSLVSISIPENVTNIGRNAFSGCSSLTDVVWNAKNCEIVATGSPYASTTPFYGVRSQITLFTFGDSVANIPNWLCYGMDNLNSIIIPYHVASVGYGTFGKCSSLASVVWNAKITEDYQNKNYAPFLDSSISSFIFGDSVQHVPAFLCYNLSLLPTLTIPQNIKTIGKNAFGQCVGLTSIEWNPITCTGYWDAEYTYPIFTGCNNVESVVFGDNVQEIPKYLCYQMSKITSLALPKSLNTIGFRAFKECSSLSTITIPKSVNTIASDAFDACTSLNKTNYTGDVATWCNIKFANSTANPINYSHNFYINDQEIKDLVIPENTGEVKFGAFFNCTSLSSITILGGVTNIRKSAFNGCSSVSKIIFGESLMKIGDYAFKGCSSLSSLVLPASVESIGDSTFYNCTSISSITTHAENPFSLGNNAFYGVKKTIPMYVPCGSVEAYESADGWNAFTNIQEPLPQFIISVSSQSNEMGEAKVDRNTYCEGVQISATAYDGYHFVQWSDGNTDNPRTLTVSQDMELTAEFEKDVDPTWQIKYTSTDGNIVTPTNEDDFGVNIVSNTYKNGVGTITFDGPVTTVGYFAFNQSTTLQTVVLPNTVNYIGEAAFQLCSSLTSINIPNGVTNIEHHAFAGCSSLTDITLPNSVSSLGDHAFYSCSSLRSVELSENMTTIEGWTFSLCTSLSSITIPNSIMTVEQYAFNETAWYNNHNDGLVYANDYVLYNYKGEASANTQLEIREGTKVISSHAFYGKQNIVSVVLPNSITTIGTYAFDGCTSLASINIPDEITTIGSVAFRNTALTSIRLPESITYVGYYAFKDCAALDTIYLESSTPPGMSSEAFTNTSVSTCVIPCGTLTTYEASIWVDKVGGFVEDCIEGLQLIYTSTDGNIVTPYATDVFGANIVSNTYKNGVGTITFDAPVTSLGDLAFHQCSSLVSVTIPNTVTSIGDRAFWNCSSLSSITIPNGVESIGEFAFYYCSSLNAITLPNSVKTIGRDAFGYCTSLKKTNYIGDVIDWCDIVFITRETNPIYYSKSFYINDQEVKDLVIPNEVDSIHDYAFENCQSITSLTIGDGVKYVGTEAFSGCSSLKDVKMGKNIVDIGKQAFLSCSSLAVINIPTSVKTIGYQAFSHCTSLTEVEIPNGVTTIGHMAFNMCGSIVSVSLPKSLTSLGRIVFYECNSISKITVEEGNAKYDSRGNCNAVIETATNTLLVGSASTIIPEGIISIETAAFRGLQALTSINIPNSVTNIGEDAFYGCPLTSITIPQNVTNIGELAFRACWSLETIYVEASTPQTIGNNAFEANSPTCYIPCGTKAAYEASDWANYMGDFVEDCEEGQQIKYTSTDGNIVTPNKTDVFGANIVSNTYENGVGTITFDAPITKIGDEAFYNRKKLASITIPKSVETIGQYAFWDCKALTAFTIPDGVTHIASEAFRGCSALTSVVIPSSVTSIGTNPFGACPGITSIVVDENNPKYDSRNNCNGIIETANNRLISGCQNTIIPYGVTNIDHAFWNCSSLKQITIPNTVTNIGTYTFSQCSLTSIVIPKSVTSIGDAAFINCPLSTIVVEEGNPKYDSRNHCNAIIITSTNTLLAGSDNTIIPEGITAISPNAFRGRKHIASIAIPNSVTRIGEYAFEGCTSLTSITIPDGVTTIKTFAFSSCDALTSVIIGKGVNSVEQGAFFNSPVETVYFNAQEPAIGLELVTGYRYFSTSPTCYIPCGTRAAYEASVWNDYMESFIETYEYTLTLSSSDNSMGSATITQEPACGTPAIIVATPNDGYLFSQWSDGNTDNPRTLSVTEDIKLTAQWTPNTNIPYIVNHYRQALDGTYPSTLKETENLMGTTAANVTPVVKTYTGFTSPEAKTATIAADGSTVVEYYYTRNQYTLTWVTDGNALTGAYSKGSVLFEAAITIPNTPTKTGYTFAGWDNTVPVTMPAEDVTLIALFTIHTYSVILTADQNGTVSGGGTYNYGESVTITATPNDGYTFSQWSDGNTDNPRTLTVTEDIELTAEFEEEGNYGSYTRTVRIGYNTICLPHGSSNFTGATFYEIAHILKNKKKIFFDEVKTLEAGKPYIFYPHSNEVTVYYDNTTSAVPLSHNGLHGTFDGITAASNFLKGKYLVAGDRMVLCGDGCSLAANRAYIELDEISDKDHPAIPGIKRVSMDYSEENATTALDNITDETIVAPMQEGVYDILGRKVDAPIVSGFYIINGKKVFVAL